VGQGEERGEGENCRARSDNWVHDASSEPFRANEGIEEVAHEAEPDGGGDDVFPHGSDKTPVGPAGKGR
jgi:hypothetical protein